MYTYIIHIYLYTFVYICTYIHTHIYMMLFHVYVHPLITYEILNLCTVKTFIAPNHIWMAMLCRHEVA